MKRASIILMISLTLLICYAGVANHEGKSTEKSRAPAAVTLEQLLIRAGLAPVWGAAAEARHLKNLADLKQPGRIRERLSLLVTELPPDERAKIGPALERYAGSFTSPSIDLTIVELMNEMLRNLETSAESAEAKAARARAREWNRKLSAAALSDGRLADGADLSWIERQRKEIGFDRLAHWALRMGGPTGARALALVLRDQGNGRGAIVLYPRDGNSPPLRVEVSYGPGIIEELKSKSADLSKVEFRPASGGRPPGEAPSKDAHEIPSGSIDERALTSALGKCVACHQEQSSATVGPQLKSIPSLRAIVPTMGKDTLERMLNFAEGRGLKSHEDRALRAHFAGGSKLSEAEPSGPPAPSCYVPANVTKAKLAEMPSIADGRGIGHDLAAAVRGRRLMFYTEDTVPRTWQASPSSPSRRNGRALLGQLGRPSYLLTKSNAVNQPFYSYTKYRSDAGHEFPWNRPAGLDTATAAASDRFVIPPAKGPLLRFGSETFATAPSFFGGSNNVNGPIAAWAYGKGTIFGEVLRNQGIPYEIRLRRRTESGWQMDVLRPFASPQELASAIRETCGGSAAPRGCPIDEQTLSQISSGTARAQFNERYLSAAKFKSKWSPLQLNTSAPKATERSASVQELPTFSRELLSALLSRPFKSVMGKPWIEGPPPGWAADGGIFPRGNFQAFIPLSQQSCMRCHEDSGRHVDNVEPKRAQMYYPHPADSPRPRTWYDHVPGMNQILSFHPFSRNAVRRGAAATSASLDPCLVQNGLVSTR